MKEIIYSLLSACENPDDSGVSFKAEAIIANPPAYGKILLFCCVNISSMSILIHNW